MSAFFVATTTITDAEKFQQYAQQAGATFAAHGGEPVLRGKFEGSLSGEADHQAVGIIKFPNLSALHDWYHSEAYQSLVPLREAAARMSIHVYST